MKKLGLSIFALLTLAACVPATPEGAVGKGAHALKNNNYNEWVEVVRPQAGELASPLTFRKLQDRLAGKELKLGSALVIAEESQETIPGYEVRIVRVSRIPVYSGNLQIASAKVSCEKYYSSERYGWISGRFGSGKPRWDIGLGMDITITVPQCFLVDVNLK